MIEQWILNLVIWFPILAGVVVLMIGDTDGRLNQMRWCALTFAMATFGLAVALYIPFNVANPHMQFVTDVMWIPLLNIRYAIGVDGISLLFILLTSFTNIIVILAAWRSIKFKLSQYMAIFLISTGIMNGIFSSLDAMLFYVFWEASMVPIYLGIGVWGGKLRAYASIKFFLYTFLGSVFMLIAILYLYDHTGSFMIAGFENAQVGQVAENLLFIAFFLAFAVKIPMWPFHTWLPDAHTEAPPGGSVVLAALMLKLGAYGMIRFNFPIFPTISHSLDWVVVGLSLMGIVCVGLATIVQKDSKRLIAYSSISHMGIVTLGLFIVYMIMAQTHDIIDASISVQGAMFQMVAHAFATGALFIGISFMSQRFGSQMIENLSGVAKVMPVFAAFFMLFAMSNIGLPGTAGFVGEFMVLISALKAHFWIALVAGLTLIIAPGYTLWMIKRVLFGEVKSDVIAKGADLSKLEILIFVLLAVPVVVFGVYPEPILNLSHAATVHFVQHISQVTPAGT